MSDNISSWDIPQQQGGYYYAPYEDNSSFEQRYQEVGEAIGPIILQGAADFVSEGAAEDPAVSGLIGLAGESVGGSVGTAIGFYRDNASAIIQNANTFVNQLNDYRTWSDPFSDNLFGN